MKTISTVSTRSPRKPLARLRALFAAATRTGVFPWETDGGTRDEEFERQVVALTNQHRAAIGVAPVHQDIGGCLEYSAVGKSFDMGKWLYLQHDQPARGSFPATTVEDRFVESGYNPSAAWGENAGYGLQTPQAITDAFLGDIGHRQNVENSGWRYMGVGVVRASNGLYFVTEDFGTEHDPVAGTPPAEQPINAASTWQRNNNHVVGKVLVSTALAVVWKGRGLPITRTPRQFRNQFTHVSG